MRGRAFGFVVLLCVTWTTARIGINMVWSQREDGRQARTKLHGAKSQFSRTYAQKPSDTLAYLTTPASKPAVAAFTYKLPQPLRDLGISQREVIPGSAFPIETASGRADGEVFASLLSLSPIPVAISRTYRPISIYAYGFWRPGEGGSGQLVNGQYGGSQSAIIMMVPVLRYRNTPHMPRFSVIGRFSTSHSRIRESEWAAGIRWHPIQSVPAQISIERRFRQDRPDAVAAYIAGGIDRAKLPLGFKLDGYGQAGIVTGKNGGTFMDGHIAAQRNIIGGEGTLLAAGGSIWGGGQDGVGRLDLGPSLRAVVPVGPAIFRIDASWRFRVAGNVQPVNGPAVTLSTSF